MRATATFVVVKADLGPVVEVGQLGQEDVLGVSHQDADIGHALQAHLLNMLLVDGPTGGAVTHRLADRGLAGAIDLALVTIREIDLRAARKQVDAAVSAPTLLDQRNGDAA